MLAHPLLTLPAELAPGETLTEIAASLGVSPEALRKANSIISDNELYPGRWLNLPDKEAATAAPATAPERPAVPRGDDTGGLRSRWRGTSDHPRHDRRRRDGDGDGASMSNSGDGDGDGDGDAGRDRGFDCS